MKEVIVFNKDVKQAFKDKLTKVIYEFDTLDGEQGERNTIKTTTIDSFNLNIKAFKVPNSINQIAYRFFRKSKAQRSFEYAHKLIEYGIGTPRPIAFVEYKTALLFKKSFYVSEQIDYDITYRDLTFNHDYPDFDIILRGFTRFTYLLHKNGIQFLDHSPGNTLIKKKGDSYSFYLVDLNRMNFGDLDFKTRVKNFSRLAFHKSMVEIMSDEYAKCTGEDYDKILNLMWNETDTFQKKYHKKLRLKRKLMFWRKFD